MGLQVVEAHLLFPYFLEKRLDIPISTFSFTSKLFFCYLFASIFNLNDKYRYCCLNYNLELPQCLHSTCQIHKTHLSFP